MSQGLNNLVHEDEGAERALLHLLHAVGWVLPKLILEDLNIWYKYNMLMSQMPEGHCCLWIVFASSDLPWQTQFFCRVFYEKMSIGGPHWFIHRFVFQISDQSIQRWARNCVCEVAILFWVQNWHAPYIMQRAVNQCLHWLLNIETLVCWG